MKGCQLLVVGCRWEFRRGDLLVARYHGICRGVVSPPGFEEL